MKAYLSLKFLIDSWLSNCSPAIFIFGYLDIERSVPIQILVCIVYTYNEDAAID